MAVYKFLMGLREAVQRISDMVAGKSEKVRTRRSIGRLGLLIMPVLLTKKGAEYTPIKMFI
jgi:hypothetical protein